jgi:osmoprotectant transport system substrate-binding protein
MIREAVLKANPRIRELIKPLMDSFDAATLQRLNERVQIDGESAESVAEEYLHARGLLKP